MSETDAAPENRAPRNCELKCAEDANCLNSSSLHAVTSNKAKYPRIAALVEHGSGRLPPEQRRLVLVALKDGKWYADTVTGSLYHPTTGKCRSGNLRIVELVGAKWLAGGAAP